MRILIVATLLTITLVSCSRVSAPTISSEIVVPPGATVSGTTYPSMPLEDFQKMQSGTSSTGAAPTIPTAL